MTKLIPSFSNDIKAGKKSEVVLQTIEKDTQNERNLFVKAVENWDEKSMIKYRYNFTVFKDSVGLKTIGYIPVQFNPNTNGVNISFFYCHFGKSGLTKADDIQKFQSTFDNMPLPDE